MELLNFKIGDDFISVIKDGICMDLHNSFEFRGYNYTVAEKNLQLIFQKSSEEWALNEVYAKLVFVFREVSFLKIREGDSSEYPEDEKCMAEIGFSTVDMRDDMDSFLASNAFKSDYDMIFTFIPGQSIKIHSKEVVLETF
jgi:hypothetical protein